MGKQKGASIKIILLIRKDVNTTNTQNTES